MTSRGLCATAFCAKTPSDRLQYGQSYPWPLRARAIMVFAEGRRRRFGRSSAIRASGWRCMARSRPNRGEREGRRRAKCVVRRSEMSEGDRCAAAGRVRAPRRLAIRRLDGSMARRLDGSVREADVPIVDVRMGRSVDAPLCRRAEPTSRGAEASRVPRPRRAAGPDRRERTRDRLRNAFQAPAGRCMLIRALFRTRLAAGFRAAGRDRVPLRLVRGREPADPCGDQRGVADHRPV